MIKYNFGDIRCELDFKKFLSININSNIYYKSDYKDFSELYELIEKQIKHIKYIKFDGYEYFLRNGLLHNLYGPALIKYNSKHEYFKGTSNWFYINGKLVHNNINMPKRGCKNLEEFNNDEIFFLEELTNKRSGKDPITGSFYRRKEGVDYIKTMINLERMKENDQRNKKIKKLNDSQK